MYRIAFAAITFAALAAPASAAVNLVSNGSFESGLTDWTLSGSESQGYPPVAIYYGAAQPYPNGAYNEAVPANNAPTNSPDGAGDRAAYFVSDFSSQSLSQLVYLTAGEYQIGFSAYAPSNGYGNAGDASFSGTIAGVTLANYLVSNGPAATWQTFQGAKTVDTAGWYEVKFTFGTDLYPSKDVVIDQVYIIAGNPPQPGVPEPATWAMLIAGFGMVGVSYRRRRAVSAA